jgi:hypothetical protein
VVPAGAAAGLLDEFLGEEMTADVEHEAAPGGREMREYFVA